MGAAETAHGLSDLDVMALTLWGEARGESLDGKAAVAWVITNRAHRRHQSIKDICLAKAQFSCWWRVGGAANYEALSLLAAQINQRTDPLLEECRWVAEGVLKGVIWDRTHEADHYLTTMLYEAAPPSWAETMPVSAVVGRHTFLRSRA